MLIKTYTTFEMARAIASVADNAPLVQMDRTDFTPNTNSRVRCGLVGLTISLRTAVESAFGLIKPLTVGTPTDATSGVRASYGNAGVSVVSLAKSISAWSAAPTYDATPEYMRRDIAPAVVGAAIAWEWPEDDPLFFSSADNLRSILVRNLTGGPCADVLVTLRWREFLPT